MSNAVDDAIDHIKKITIQALTVLKKKHNLKLPDGKDVSVTMSFNGDDLVVDYELKSAHVAVTRKLVLDKSVYSSSFALGGALSDMVSNALVEFIVKSEKSVRA